jgi:hypothetical protein
VNERRLPYGRRRIHQILRAERRQPLIIKIIIPGHPHGTPAEAAPQDRRHLRGGKRRRTRRRLYIPQPLQRRDPGRSAVGDPVGDGDRHLAAVSLAHLDQHRVVIRRGRLRLRRQRRPLSRVAALAQNVGQAADAPSDALPEELGDAGSGRGRVRRRRRVLWRWVFGGGVRRGIRRTVGGVVREDGVMDRQIAHVLADRGTIQQLDPLQNSTVKTRTKEVRMDHTNIV